jgi:hypothetical protein
VFLFLQSFSQAFFKGSLARLDYFNELHSIVSQNARLFGLSEYDRQM